jgi:UDP-N-acetylmuramoyl-tripeptide--D-alanyl-D-alanine ligase
MLPLEDLYQLYRQHPVVSTDSRQITPGCIFFALKGEHFDGNRYAAGALEKGAAYAVTDDPTLPDNARCLRVTNVLQMLQALALHHRRQFDIPVIAIGGSNGKTTTKELVSAVLSSHYPCHFTKGNLNNHIGVPLTLLSMPPETEVAVIEMGTNRPGDIEELCAIAEPTHGLLTNIGKEHLEGFGNIAGVKKAEGELYRYLHARKGCLFVNLSEKYLDAMTRRNDRKVAYGRSENLQAGDAKIDIRLIRETPFVQAAFMSEEGRETEVQTRLIGRHNFNNIMTAIALGVYFKVPAAKIKTALEVYTPSNNRSQLLARDTNTILLDAYNANPSSMVPAIEALNVMPGKAKVAILGDMLELGVDSVKEHEAVLRKAARMRFDRLVLVGPEFGKTTFKKYGALHFPDYAAAKNWFEKQNFDGAAVLIKGSRGIALEKIL